VRSNSSHINHIESGYITFTADSGADVTVKHGNGDGLNDFDPDTSIPLEVADQRKVFTKGKGCIAGKIDNISCCSNLFNFVTISLSDVF
jgi:hypothetical protein